MDNEAQYRDMLGTNILQTYETSQLYYAGLDPFGTIQKGPGTRYDALYARQPEQQDGVLIKNAFGIQQPPEPAPAVPIKQNAGSAFNQAHAEGGA